MGGERQVERTEEDRTLASSASRKSSFVTPNVSASESRFKALSKKSADVTWMVFCFLAAGPGEARYSPSVGAAEQRELIGIDIVVVARSYCQGLKRLSLSAAFCEISIDFTWTVGLVLFP